MFQEITPLEDSDFNCHFVDKFRKNTKPSKFIYNFFVNRISKMSNNAEEKWSSKDWFDQNLDWEKVYMLPRLCTGESCLRSFQYSLVHRSIFTNSRLVKAKIITGPSRCTFCNIDEETIEHLFCFCPKSRSLYLQLIAMIKEHFEINIEQNDLNPNNIIFGFLFEEETKNSINHLFILTKNSFILVVAIILQIPVSKIC